MATRTATAKVPVALPKGESTASSLVSQDVSLHMAIGARARITTNSSTVEGTIYVADPLTNLLVLNTSPASAASTISSSTLVAPPGAYRIFPISQITSFQLLNLPPPQTQPQSSSSSTLDTNALQARLTRAVAASQTAQLRQGPKGTTPTDQALFDALSRTHPARWDTGTGSMIISDTFAIDKPYNAAQVRFLAGSAGVGDLERMRKVVDMERNKVLLRMGKGEIDGRMNNAHTNASAGAGLKKGG